MGQHGLKVCCYVGLSHVQTLCMCQHGSWAKRDVVYSAARTFKAAACLFAVQLYVDLHVNQVTGSTAATVVQLDDMCGIEACPFTYLPTAIIQDIV